MIAALRDVRPPLWPGPVVAELRALRADPVPTPPGDGRPALLVGGFGAPAVAMRPLADWLRGGGWAVRTAALGRGIDCGERSATALEGQLAAAADKHGSPVALIAHSRGGQFARVAATRRPDLVASLATLGTPFEHFALHPILQAQCGVLGLAGSLGVPGLVRLGCLRGACCERFRVDLPRPVPQQVAFTAVYSERDTTVRWRTCRDPAATNVEVGGSHVGMLANRRAYAAIASTLRRAG